MCKTIILGITDNNDIIMHQVPTFMEVPHTKKNKINICLKFKGNSEPKSE